MRTTIFFSDSHPQNHYPAKSENLHKIKRHPSLFTFIFNSKRSGLKIPELGHNSLFFAVLQYILENMVLHHAKDSIPQKIKELWPNSGILRPDLLMSKYQINAAVSKVDRTAQEVY